MGKVGYVSVFWLRWCLGKVGGRLGPGSGRVLWCYVCVVSLDALCRWQVHVSVYCARRIPAHLRCTQCSILLHLINICFLTCICLWQISQIQTCLRVVVVPGLVSTSPAFMRSITSHPAGTTTPGSSTVMNSALSSSQTEMLLTFRPSLTKTDLPCWLCGRLATSAIPG